MSTCLIVDGYEIYILLYQVVLRTRTQVLIQKHQQTFRGCKMLFKPALDVDDR